MLGEVAIGIGVHSAINRASTEQTCTNFGEGDRFRFSRNPLYHQKRQDEAVMMGLLQILAPGRDLVTPVPLVYSRLFW